jgi:hypothetical protein
MIYKFRLNFKAYYYFLYAKTLFVDGLIIMTNYIVGILKINQKLLKYIY